MTLSSSAIDLHIASSEDVGTIMDLVLASLKPPANALPSSPQEIERRVRQVITTPNGAFHWVIAKQQADVAVVSIAEIPAPPIYDLPGGHAAVTLGTWLSSEDLSTSTVFDAVEEYKKSRGAAMLVTCLPRTDQETQAVANSRNYRATTDFMLKTGLVSGPLQRGIRAASTDDIDHLVAFNEETRQRLHEANPQFWNSHPEARARFAFWMRMSLNMRDRQILVAMNEVEPTGFIIAQPASPIQVPLTLDDSRMGVIDDFHAMAFGSSLTKPSAHVDGRSLLAAAESELATHGKQEAIAICPSAWTAKQALLREAGYATLSTWFTKPAVG